MEDMVSIFAISDIHGCLKELDRALKLVDLSENNKLVFLGDYIDYGTDSYGVLQRVWELQKQHGDKVIVLKGNHEEMFLEFLFSDNDEWICQDEYYTTATDFLTKEQRLEFQESVEMSGLSMSQIIDKYVRNVIKSNHAEMITWLENLPKYYETEQQIFVHAGVEEELGEYWKEYGAPKTLLWKETAAFGQFYKDVIAGHIATAFLSKDAKERGIFYDGENHFYVDGSVFITHRIPVLRIEQEIGRYVAFWEEKGEWKNEVLRWKSGL